MAMRLGIVAFALFQENGYNKSCGYNLSCRDIFHSQQIEKITGSLSFPRFASGEPDFIVLKLYIPDSLFHRYKYNKS